MNFIDEKYLKGILFDVIIIKMSKSINVREIENVFHKCSIYVLLNIYFDDLFRIVSIKEHLHKKIHVIKNLKCKILLDIDILNAKQINIDLINKVMIISTCQNLVVIIKIVSKSNVRIKRIVHVKKIIIFDKTIIKMSIYLKKKLFDDRDYFFESNQTELTVVLKKIEGFYIHICNCNVDFVQIKNDKFISIVVFRRVRLRTFTKYEKKNCYQIENEYYEIAILIQTNEINA